MIPSIPPLVSTRLTVIDYRPGRSSCRLALVHLRPRNPFIQTVYRKIWNTILDNFVIGNLSSHEKLKMHQVTIR